MYLLDTNVISEVRRQSTANKAVAHWFANQSPTSMTMSVVTLQELYYGAFLRIRKDELTGSHILRWIEDYLVVQFDGRIIPMDHPIAKRVAQLHVPTTRPYRDSVIAATALEFDLIVATRNTRDFTPMGIRVFNPWDHAL